MSDWREYEKRSGGQIKSAAWRAMHRPCVAFEDGEPGSRVGASKVGGEPDLPPGFAWPCAGEQPLHFVAQFELREVSDAGWRETDFREAFALPTSGLLSIFHDPVAATVRVHHFTGALSPRNARGGASPEYFLRAVLAPERALPRLDDPRFEELTATAQAWLAELYAADGRARDVEARAQLGGYVEDATASGDVCFASVSHVDTLVSRARELHLRETVRTAKPPQGSAMHRFRNLLARHGDDAVRRELQAMGAPSQGAVESQFHELSNARAERARTQGRETLHALLKDEA